MQYPIDLNNLDEYPLEEGENSIITTAIEYGEKFGTDGVTGRLMTLEDVEALGGNRGNGISWGTTSGCPEFVNIVEGKDLSYWLASASNNSQLWNVSGYHRQLYYTGSIGDRLKVRPVIEIPISLIQ